MKDLNKSTNFNPKKKTYFKAYIHV